MRLDHLLSKEHLALRAASDRPGVHCSIVGHWLFIQVVSLLPACTCFPPGRPRNGGAGGSPGWARCWVPRERAPCPGLRFAGRGCHGADARWRPGAVRFLRTAQWTRASILGSPALGGGVCVVFLCQVFKGTRWMPWHQEPMKDAGACDMPRGAGSQAVIRGFPNGETWRPLWAVAAA